MSIHTKEDLDRLSRFTRQRYSQAFMSDTKWRKLFAAIWESGWRPSLVQVKFVESTASEYRLMCWPSPNSFWGPEQWVDTPEFGPIELRSIEWLAIPHFVIPELSRVYTAPSEVRQDFAAIKTALSRVGEFPLEETAEGLKIVGYR